MDRANLMHIREAIASGNITPEEVVERLSAAIEAEYNKPDPDVDFINACENLLWELGTHGQQPFVSATERYLAAIAEQPRPSRAPRWIAAAAAVLVLCLGIGGFKYTWFTQTSSEDQQQYVIQGHEVTVEMISAAIAEHDKSESLSTSDWDEVVGFLGFEPSIPNGEIMDMVITQYSAIIEPNFISCNILYQDVNTPSLSALYSATYYTNAQEAYISFEQDHSGTCESIGDLSVYSSQNIEKSTFSWVHDSVVYYYGGQFSYDIGRNVIESLIGE